MTRGEAKGGYILVAVLGVMVILTGFMAAGSVLLRSALDTARVEDADAAMTGLTRGGLELAAYQLFVIKASPDAVEGRRIKFGGGKVAPHIVDEGGKADLNASEPALLAGVFQSVGIDARSVGELVAYIVDMRGADRNGQAAGSTPAPAASAQPNQKKLRGFQSVDQLRDAPDLSPDDLHELMPLLTVYNPDGKINVMTATKAMLSAIPDMSSAEVEVILQHREGAGPDEAEHLTSTLGKAKAYVKTKSGPAYTVRIDATSEKGRKKAIHAVIAASKSPNDPYYVLDWWE